MTLTITKTKVKTLSKRNLKSIQILIRSTGVVEASKNWRAGKTCERGIKNRHFLPQAFALKQ